MRKLTFDYSMRVDYETPVANCYYTFKCIPADTARQRLEEIRLSVKPGAEEFPKETGRGTDSFGNRFLYGSVRSSHDSFLFCASGVVSVGLSDRDPLENPAMLGAYRYPHGLTVPGEGLRNYWESVRLPEEDSAFRKCERLMHCLYRDFTYEKGVTQVNTTAEEAWRQRKGVCQDYAHILVTLYRLAGFPARYVMGMLLGEGYSHAWAEALCDGSWYAFDPTNDCVVTDSHIRLGVGRDASDCRINRGVIHGGGAQTQTVSVIVRDADA